MQSAEIKQIEGRAVAVPGNDIDTDRIVPARFLKCVTFDGLGAYAFADDRAQEKAAGRVHPFDAPGAPGATILLVGNNFGCGSSREHAPQALMRWGIRAIVGQSFAEIFFGNCTANGVPCVTASAAALEPLLAAQAHNRQAVVTLDLTTMRVRAGEVEVAVTMPPGAREQLLSGRWDTTAELLAGRALLAQTAAKLPYFSAWQ